MSEALIESRQFIGWWRNAVSDAITSSAYTGKRAIHSSDFSAFTKRSHCPSLLQFSGPKLIPTIIHLHFGDCLSGTLFSLRWSAMEYRRWLPPCARFIVRKDPHSKCIKCLGFSHARDAVYGISKCKICENFCLITLRSRLSACENESSIFPRRAPEASAASREIAASPGVRMLSSRRWRVSRQASPFLSLPLRSVFAWIQPVGEAATTLRVYVAAIAARRELVETSDGLLLYAWSQTA